jgi:hypothetical protein
MAEKFYMNMAALGSDYKSLDRMHPFQARAEERGGGYPGYCCMTWHGRQLPASCPLIPRPALPLQVLVLYDAAGVKLDMFHGRVWWVRAHRVFVGAGALYLVGAGALFLFCGGCGSNDAAAYRPPAAHHLTPPPPPPTRPALQAQQLGDREGNDARSQDVRLPGGVP